MTMQHTSPRYVDVQVDTEIPSLVKTPNEVQLFLFSAITWDTHRTHWDIPYSVNEESLPGILVHGHLQGTFLTQLVTDWVTPEGRLLEIDYQNRGYGNPGRCANLQGQGDSQAGREWQGFSGFGCVD